MSLLWHRRQCLLACLLITTDGRTDGRIDADGGVVAARRRDVAPGAPVERTPKEREAENKEARGRQEAARRGKGMDGWMDGWMRYWYAAA